MSSAHESVFDYFVLQAEWREHKAMKHPEDARNNKSAFALRQLADYVRDLSPDDYRVKRLALLVCPTGEALPGEEATMVARQVGFTARIVATPAESLGIFLDAAMRDFQADPSSIEPAEQLQFIVDHQDSPEGLEGMRYLRSWLDSIEEDLVLKARVEGWSWQRIGDAIGQSKQAVWERYRDPQDRTPDED
jgi:hypothetical protein